MLAAGLGACASAPERGPEPLAARHELVHLAGEGLRDAVSHGRRVGVSGDRDSAGIAVEPGGMLLSRALRAERPFREALASWNVDAPDGAGFAFELSVRTEEGDWSPWLHVGEWGRWGERRVADEPGRPSGSDERDGPADGPADDPEGLPPSTGEHAERLPAPPRPEPTVAFDGGRIDVDYLAGEVDFDALRFRIRAAEAGPAPIEVHRVTLCLTAFVPPEALSGVAIRGGERAPDPPSLRDPSSGDAATAGRDAATPTGPATEEHAAGTPAAPTRAVVLDVPPRSQRELDAELAPRACSPTSVAMVLAWRGVDVPTERVAELLYDPRHDLYGNWTRAIQGAFELGVPGYLRRFSGWPEVEREIARGQPIVASIRVEAGALAGAPYESTAGHLLVVVGFDERGDVVVADPAAAAPAEVRRTYDRAELGRAWFEKGGVAYVLLEP